MWDGESVVKASRRRAIRAPRGSQTVRTLLFWSAMLLLPARHLRAQNQPDWSQYNIPFPNTPLPQPPQDGVSAIQSFAQRANTWIEYLACGTENRFLRI